MANLKVVVGPDGDIRAAVKLNPNNNYSPTEVEVKEDQGESLYEVTLPEELVSGSLGELVNYQFAQGDGNQLVKRTH